MKKSEFKFEAYKIDTLTLTLEKSVELLSFNGHIPTDKWSMNIGVRDPIYIKSKAAYISGLNIALDVLGDNDNEDENPPSLISIKAGISGLFKVKDDRFLEEHEKDIVRIQFPSLLLPYLRSSITGLIANAGLGTFIFPLINIRDAIKSSMKAVEIQVIE